MWPLKDKPKRQPKPMKLDEPGTYYVGGKHIVVPVKKKPKKKDGE